jgi:hypothetical protein
MPSPVETLDQAMSHDQIQAQILTAAEARQHVVELEAERALALSTGISTIDAYMDDLDAEIDAWRHHLVTAAVTEIATLRAELFGADIG